MANKLYEETSVNNIAKSIQAKLGVTTTYKIGEMSAAIDSIVVGHTGYLHKIGLATSSTGSATYTCNIWSTSSTEIGSTANLAKWLYDNGFTSTSTLMVAVNTSGTMKGIYSTNGTTISSSATSAIPKYYKTDTVEEIE